MTAAEKIDDRRPLSVPQLADRWGCSEGLVYRLIRERRLQCFRPGTLIRIPFAEVERFECQTTACNASGADLQSSIASMESASAEPLQRRIDRAPRRRRVTSGEGPTIARGPWPGA